MRSVINYMEILYLLLPSSRLVLQAEPRTHVKDLFMELYWLNVFNMHRCASITSLKAQVWANPSLHLLSQPLLGSTSWGVSTRGTSGPRSCPMAGLPTSTSQAGYTTPWSSMGNTNYIPHETKFKEEVKIWTWAWLGTLIWPFLARSSLKVICT